MSEVGVPPGYDVRTVEGAVLELAAELHPGRLPADELVRKTVTDAGDPREIETARRAIGNLRELGLFRRRDDEMLELTQATRQAVSLLTGI